MQEPDKVGTSSQDTPSDSSFTDEMKNRAQFASPYQDQLNRSVKRLVIWSRELWSQQGLLCSTSDNATTLFMHNMHNITRIVIS